MNLPDLQLAKIRTNNKVNYYDNDYIIPEEVKDIGKNKKYLLLTYGCQMNVHDSENIRGILEDLKYQECSKLEEADIIILNTCAIRENAHNKVMGMLGRIKHLKETKKDIITCVCGCMPQEEVITNLIKDKYPWVDIVFGTHNTHKLPIYLKDLSNQQIEVFSIEGNVYENIPFKRDSKYSAWINIQYGCDKFCTYCIVPYTRGKQRSRRKEDILKEVNDLVNDGYQEVTLLGQNVNAYGKELYKDYNLANLLEDVSKTGINRVRFVTSHPWDFTDDMIDIIAKYDNIMPYIHLPLQSGSNKILKLMGRKYTKEEYIELFKKIKKKIPHCAITTDIIVGFPQETNKDFQDTLDLVNLLKYDLAYTFIFSKREGTPACRLEDNTSLEEKEARLQELNNLINKYALENNLLYQDKIVEVLLIEQSKKEGCLQGYTDTMKLVNVKASKELLGQIVKVKITKVKTWSLDGVLV